MRLPGAHAEVTAVNGARGAGLTPQGISTSHRICPSCRTFLEGEGATITGRNFGCPCCGEKTELHAPAPEERTIWASGVGRLARLPFRPDAVINTADLAPVLEAVETHIAA